MPGIIAIAGEKNRGPKTENAKTSRVNSMRWRVKRHTSITYICAVIQI